MDDHTFDHWTRRLTARLTRRRVTQAAPALGAIAAVAGVGMAAPGEAKRKRCRRPKRRCGKACVNLQTSKRHCGSCNTRCASGEACLAGVCRECGTGGDCLAFLMSFTYRTNGAMGGLSGADAKCQTAADAASLPGTYRAWLSDTTGSPSTQFTQNPGRYVRVDGKVLAANWRELTSGRLQRPLNVTEQGIRENIIVFTGTQADGTPAPTGPNLGYCEDWTEAGPETAAVSGNPNATESSWSTEFTTQCSSSQVLYCFQQNG